MKSICRLVIEKRISPRCYYGRFFIGPLDKGQGLIHGTTLRRLLLNLEGPSIRAVSIRNLKHEFDTLRGLHESTSEILANFEQVVISDQGDYNALTGYNDQFFKQTQTIHLQCNGPKVLRSGDLKLLPPFGIVDPNQYIATLGVSANLEMILLVENNYQIPTVTPFPIPTFILKTGNSVVTNVNINVLNLSNDYEECLMLEIWTNGTISPSRALRLSSSMACSFYGQFLEVQGKISGGRIRTSE